MTGKLLIYGAGAHARKVFHYAIDLGWQVEGFVDDRPGVQAPVAGLPVHGPDALLVPVPDMAAFVAIGDAAIRSLLLGGLASRGWRLPVIAHRLAWLAPDVIPGAGSLIAAGAVVETGTKLGRGVIIDVGAVVDHDCRIGDFCHLRPGTTLGPGTTVPSPGTSGPQARG